jgi:NADH-quinone oxidoreductase subunit A
MSSSLLAVLLLGTIVFIFGVVLLFLSSLVGPKRKKGAKLTSSDIAKTMPYECGIPGQETEDSKVSVKFYLTAILFIIFDIEIIFMYPWAVTFMDFVKKGQGIYILGTMGVFILLFVVGLIWEVKSKALDWN